MPTLIKKVFVKEIQVYKVEITSEMAAEFNSMKKHFGKITLMKSSIGSYRMTKLTKKKNTKLKINFLQLNFA
jgi:hypothetical protein